MPTTTRVHDTPVTTRQRALVLGIEHPRGIAGVCSLGQRGGSVVGVERDPAARGRGSRYVRQVVMVEDGEARTLSALEALVARQFWAVARNAHRIRAFAYLSVRDPHPAVADLAQFAKHWRASLRGRIARTVLPPTSTLGSVARGLRRR